MTMRLAPAKINLSLRLLGKREDGFHEIDTLMAPIDLADELDFHNSRTTTLLCENPNIPTDETNLVFKAVRAFEASYGRKVKQRITLTKHCPHGAGLGGGSSDAAQTLVYLNELLGTAYDKEEMSAMAASLGSDVSFFLNPVPSRCTGRGEICTAIESLKTWTSPIVILKPDFAVSTAGAYKNYAKLRKANCPKDSPQELDGLELVNDLEQAVFAKFPVLAIMKAWLLEQKGTRAAMMSGSGSSLFALTEDIAQAQAIAKAARKKFGASIFTHVGWVNPQ